MANSLELSLKPMITFDSVSGRCMRRPKSRVVSSDVLFLPISMIASPTERFSVIITVVPPFTVKFPSTTRLSKIATLPETTRTFEPNSST